MTSYTQLNLAQSGSQPLFTEQGRYRRTVRWFVKDDIETFGRKRQWPN